MLHRMCGRFSCMSLVARDAHSVNKYKRVNVWRMAIQQMEENTSTTIKTTPCCLVYQIRAGGYICLGWSNSRICRKTDPVIEIDP